MPSRKNNHRDASRKPSSTPSMNAPEIQQPVMASSPNNDGAAVDNFTVATRDNPTTIQVSGENTQLDRDSNIPQTSQQVQSSQATQLNFDPAYHQASGGSKEYDQTIDVASPTTESISTSASTSVGPSSLSGTAAAGIKLFTDLTIESAAHELQIYSLRRELGMPGGRNRYSLATTASAESTKSSESTDTFPSFRNSVAGSFKTMEGIEEEGQGAKGQGMMGEGMMGEGMKAEGAKIEGSKGESANSEGLKDDVMKGSDMKGHGMKAVKGPGGKCQSLKRQSLKRRGGKRQGGSSLSETTTASTTTYGTGSDTPTASNASGTPIGDNETPNLSDRMSEWARLNRQAATRSDSVSEYKREEAEELRNIIKSTDDAEVYLPALKSLSEIIKERMVARMQQVAEDYEKEETEQVEQGPKQPRNTI